MLLTYSPDGTNVCYVRDGESEGMWWVSGVESCKIVLGGTWSDMFAVGCIV